MSDVILIKKRVAILVDGGFYRKVAAYNWGKKTGEERATELCAYCMAHARGKDLYRVFYYDCPPIAQQVYHPFLKRNVNLKKNDTYLWAQEFFEKMKTFRKFALRLGEISPSSVGYSLKKETLKKLMAGERTVDNLEEKDFIFTAEQKGVDMRIGLDIASLAYKKLVDQIILISGDSDFVPAAKLARREGIDFILDPMWQDIRADLKEHIDGLTSKMKSVNEPESSNV